MMHGFLYKVFPVIIKKNINDKNQIQNKTLTIYILMTLIVLYKYLKLNTPNYL